MDLIIILPTVQLGQAVTTKETEYSTVFQPLSNSSSFRQRTGLETQRIWSDCVSSWW